MRLLKITLSSLLFISLSGCIISVYGQLSNLNQVDIKKCYQYCISITNYPYYNSFEIDFTNEQILICLPKNNLDSIENKEGNIQIPLIDWKGSIEKMNNHFYSSILNV